MGEGALVAGALAGVGGAYVRGLGRLPGRSARRSAAGEGNRPANRRWQPAAFVAGLGTVAVALAPPLAHLAEERLWAHMTQHVLLVTVAAALVVLADPVPALLWALPAGARRAVSARLVRLNRSHSRPTGWAAWATAALVVQTVVMWGWHAPDAYQAALRSPVVHALEHASFLAAGLFFWWAVGGSHRRSLYGPGVVVTFLAALQGTALGALMTLAPRPWYPSYSGTAATGDVSGLTPLADQQVAGVVMWGPGGLVYALGAVVLFGAWLSGPPVAETRPGGAVASGGERRGSPPSRDRGARPR